MRLFIFLILISISGNLFASSVSDQKNERKQEKSIQALLAEGKKTVKSISDPEAKKYYSLIIDEAGNDIKYLYMLQSPQKYRYFPYGTKIRDSYYNEYLKPQYQKLIEEAKNSSSYESITESEKTLIEKTTLSYQKEFIDPLKKSLGEILTQDLFQEGNMHIGYTASGGYMNIDLTDITAKSSLKRDEQMMEFVLTVDMKMVMPNNTDCDYDESWNYVCASTGSLRISPKIGAKMKIWTNEDTYMMALSDLSMDMRDSDNSTREELLSLKKTLEKYTDGKIYSFPLPSSLGISSTEIFSRGYALIKLLSETSILTPWSRIPDGIILDINPLFRERFSEIFQMDDEESIVHLDFPRIIYRDGKYMLSYADSSYELVDIVLAPNSESKPEFTITSRSHTDGSTFSGKISPNKWDIRYQSTDAYNGMELSSIWDGYNTRTILSGSGIREWDKDEEKYIIQTYIVSGILSSSIANLELRKNDSTIGGMRLISNSSSEDVRLWFTLEDMRFELSSYFRKQFGKYPITFPKDTIEVDDMDDFENIIDLPSRLMN